MAKITDPDDLNVGVEITINTSTRTFTLLQAGNLNFKEGVTIQALYSKFIELWTSSTYNRHPFPMYTIDARSGQFQFGTDGNTFNGWKPANDTTRQALRDGGWSEFSTLGVLNRQYVGIVQLGEVNVGAQMYYQRSLNGIAFDFTFDDEVNEGIQVFGDATNGNFDTRTFFKLYSREFGKLYDDAVLGDVGETSTGAFKIQLPVSNADDLKITDNDTIVSSTSPYTGITIEFFGTNQNKTIGGGSYPFRKVINGNNATLEQIYTKMQYLLRQDTDIDSGAGTVIGKTADLLCYFVGDTLYTTLGVFIENIQANDVNRIVFLDQNNIERIYPFTSSGSLSFNSFLTSGGTGYYRMYFTNDDAGSNLGNDFGTSTAITVNDSSGTPISGLITSSTIPFTYDYDGNIQRGVGSDGEDAPITIVAGNIGVAKPVIVNGVITRNKGISISLVAEQDRAYLT